MTTDQPQLLDQSVRPRSNVRWWICGLLFASTTINYIDRQLFANLIPYFEDELRLGPMDLARINVAFLLSYGLSMMFVGRFIDRVGTRVGLALTFLLWNVASAGHALVGSVIGFILIRILLGIGESGNFPAAVKTVAEWFPKRSRALATGWFNCGSNIGAVVTPPLVAAIAIPFGWRVCFAILSCVGLVWLIFWLWIYRRPEEHRKVSAEELAFIRSDPPDAVSHVGILTLLSQRQVYAIAIARFFSDAPWWFYLTWMPKLLVDRFGLTPYTMATAVAAIYLVADFGAVGGGWISSSLLKRGYSANAARKIGLLCAALGPVPIIAVGQMDGSPIAGLAAAWIAVPLVALAAASHQAWSSNMYTVISDTLPKSAVAMTVGIGTATAAVGSAVFQFVVALWLLHTGNYMLPFLLAGSLYLVALLSLHLILPRLQPADIGPETRPRIRTWQVVTALAVLAGALLALQVQLNKPPYRSVDDYYAKRAAALGARAQRPGPSAKVGWQEAKWIIWDMPDGTSRLELIRLDRDGRPNIEGKGAAARKYQGPPASELDALRNVPATRAVE